MAGKTPVNIPPMTRLTTVSTNAVMFRKVRLVTAGA
jgi:hypothetical protein